VSPASGVGSGTAALVVTENTVNDARTATVTIDGQALRVVQSGGCSYTLDPTSLDINNDGGPASVAVSTTDACSWTATASESWIRLLNTSGTGSGRVSLEAAANSGAERHAYVTIGGQRVNITQQGR